MVDVRIRRALPVEAARLTAVAHAAKRHWGYPDELILLWREDLTVTPAQLAERAFFCAEEDGAIVGFHALSPDGAELDHLWVDPPAMGRGIGAALFRHAAGTARDLGIALLRITSDPHAERFYLRMGAERLGDVASLPAGRTLPLLVVRPARDTGAGSRAVSLRRRASVPQPSQRTGGAGMITVHHLENSRSQRVLWLLEELGLPYEIRHYKRDPQSMLAPPELRAIHPLGKSPVITDGPLVLAESGAILEYLVDTYGNGRLRPAAGTPERVQYTYWMHYAEGSVMPPLLFKLVFDVIENAPMPFFVRPFAKAIAGRAKSTFIGPQIKLHLDFIESELAKHEWFVGDELTAADVAMSFPLEAAAARAGLDRSRPKSMAFLDRIHARPAYRTALEKGGPYELLK